jgi:hypothetical protein
VVGTQARVPAEQLVHDVHEPLAQRDIILRQGSGGGRG